MVALLVMMVAVDSIGTLHAEPAPGEASPAISPGLSQAVTPANTASPTPEHIAKARQLILATGISRSFQIIIPEFMDQIGNTLTQARPELVHDMSAVLDGLRPEFDSQSDEMVNLSARIYATLLSEKDIEAILRFFDSDAGKLYVSAQPLFLNQLVSGMRAWQQKIAGKHDGACPTRDEEERSRPVTNYDCDLFVIGAGSGGTRAARIAAQYGARVMIAEEFRVGGTCVIRGCVPKKLMVYASRFADAFADAEGFGWTVPKATFDWRSFVEAKEREITRLSAIYVSNLQKAGVVIHDSRVTVVGAHAVRLSNGTQITAETILIATGGTPVLPDDLPGRDLAISSNEIFDLPQFPRRLVIVGGGYIGVEFASVFARLGAKVTLVNRSANILRGFDDDMRDGVREALSHAGVDFRMKASLSRIGKEDNALAVALRDGSILPCDQVLVAVGRSPHTKDLGLEEIGVELGEKGEICVDAASRSSVPSIYAVGDVTNRVALTPIAIREGQAFADNVYGKMDTVADHSKIPTAVFTTPEIGTVGLTEAQATTLLPCVDIYAAAFRPMKATLSGRNEKVIMKMVVDGNTDVVLGVHILGEDAGEMAQLVGVAVKSGAKKADFDRTCAVHPTAAEELVTLRTRRVRHERMVGEPTGPGMADAVA